MAEILIVDDEAAVRGLLTTLLESHHHACTGAGSAEAARQKLTERSFDLILLDIKLPGESGLEFLEYVGRQYPETATVMVTVLGDTATAIKALALGAYGYVAKPFESNEILINVASALRRRDLEISNRSYAERLESLVAEKIAALQASEMRHRLLLDALPDPVVAYDDEDRAAYVNQAFIKTFGWSREELIGRPIDFVPPEEKDERRLAVKRLLSGQELMLETKRLTKDGRKLDVLVRAAMIQGAPDPGYGTVVILKDITDRKRAEAAILAERERFRVLNEESPLGVCLIRPDGGYEYVNPAFVRMFGYTLEDVPTGREWFRRAFPDPAYRRRQIHSWVAAVGDKAGQSIKTQTSTVTCHDGTTKIVHFRAVDLGDGEYLVLSEDVTEQKMLESQLVQAQKLESIGQLAAGIAHEINTPTQYVTDNTKFLQEAFADLLSVVDKYGAFCRALESGAPPDELEEVLAAGLDQADLAYLREEVPRAVDQSLEGLGRVAAIVRSMKEFSHPGRETKGPVDLNRAIESTITVARNEWKYVADVETEFDPALPLVPCLAGEMNQVMLNIVVNAAQAIAEVIDEGSGNKGRIRVTTRRVGDKAEIQISDTGAGMSPEIKDRIFDPFFTTKEPGKGTGQGLAIAYRVIRDTHGGSITCDSAPGRGTTFTIRLPLTPVPVDPDA